MTLSDPVARVWSAFLSQTSRPLDTPVYDVFSFGDREALANDLGALVCAGAKVATASLLWEYPPEGKGPPKQGDLSVVTDWSGAPLCVIETTSVEVRAFEDVEEGFAAAEGEGDLTLAWWRDAHWAYFGRACERLGRERSVGMPVVCERFRVVYRPESPRQVGGGG